MRNYWCCCGTQIGIGWGPGLTRELARWMVHGSADVSMRAFDPRRFGDYADKSGRTSRRGRLPAPPRDSLPPLQSPGRPTGETEPLYERLKEQGAVFEEVYGHERPRWFATVTRRRKITTALVAISFTSAWEEHRAVRERVGIMDICAFTKVEVAGPDAESLLNGLIANTLPAMSAAFA